MPSLGKPHLEPEKETAKKRQSSTHLYSLVVLCNGLATKKAECRLQTAQALRRGSCGFCFLLFPAGNISRLGIERKRNHDLSHMTCHWALAEVQRSITFTTVDILRLHSVLICQTTHEAVQKEIRNFVRVKI